jgi:shikimate dehydrogenase
MINGETRLIAHLGVPTTTFKSPMIYNPFFERHGINAVVVPMGCEAADYAEFLRLLFRLRNIQGALVTMPHKLVTAELVDEVSATAAVAGACNAVKAAPDGRLIGDMFDGEGFVRGAAAKGVAVAGRRALVVGCGGVGSAIAGSLARAGAGEIGLFDGDAARMAGLAERLGAHYPALRVTVETNDPAGWDIAVNATPLGMNEGDPLPFDVSRLAPETFVGEVVLKAEVTPLVAAARARGCQTQVGLDMLFEMIPAYLEFFGFPSATADELRAGARLAG